MLRTCRRSPCRWWCSSPPRPVRIQAFEARAVDYLLKPIDVCLRGRSAGAEHVRARTAADQRDRLLQIIAEITGCGELGSMSLLEHGRQAIDGRGPRSAESARVRREGSRARGMIEWIDAAGDYMCIHAAGDTTSCAAR